MRYKFTSLNGVPAWQHEDGTVLPIMAGAQDDYEEALRRLREAGGEEEKEPSDLDQLLGQVLVDMASRTQGILKTRTDRRTGQRVYWLSEDGRAFNLGPSPTLMSPSTFQLYTLTPMGTAMSGGKASQFQLEQFGFLEGAGAAGSTYHPPAWRPGELELEQQQLQADIAATEQRLQEIRMQEAAADARQRRQLQAEMRMLEKRLDNDKRTLLYGEIGAATRTVFQAQEAERGRQQEMAGEDALRFMATLRGRGTTGRTPADIFKQQGAAFVNQPLPQFSIEDPIPMLEAGLQGLQKMAVAGAPQGLIPGMAQGGIIEMERGGDGAFSMRPKQSFLVGEAGPEVLTVGDGKVEVTPFGGGAQGGLSFNFSDLDLGGLPDLLESLRRSRGLGGFLAQPGFGGETLSVRDVLLPHQAAALGAFQRPVGSLFQARPSGGDPTGAVFTMDPSGMRRGITPSAAGAFDLKETQYLLPGQMARIERGADIRDPSFQMPLPSYEGAFGALGQPLNVRQGMLELAAVNPSFSRQDAINLSNMIGFLPAPHKIAREFSLLDPTEQQGVLSLYELAGFPEASFEGIIGAATPRAGAFGGRRIGFTGGFV